ncbi:MAG TPA: hypothetical protein VN900_07350 [Stellaceae bacterium]|nr:hypothetical protein [Stellaceae bacterium]
MVADMLHRRPLHPRPGAAALQPQRTGTGLTRAVRRASVAVVAGIAR